MSSCVKNLFGEKIYNIYKECLESTTDLFKELDDIKLFNQNKVLEAFKKERISDSHFTSTSGYAYTDIGRDGVERLYSRIFNAESSLVRVQFVNGTHAIGCALLGNLFRGDTLFSITGTPYDTIHNIIGMNSKNNKDGSLKSLGVNYLECDLKENGFDKDKIIETIKNNKSITFIYIQRSRGYSLRRALSISDINDIVKIIKDTNKEIKIFLDNCYGEFLEIKEPTDIGVDLIAGSLIKNIGGGLAPTGGYVVGKKELVENASYRLTVPGIGAECGANLSTTKLLLQGLFTAPHVVIEAVKTAIFSAKIFEILGYEVFPKYNEPRSDIIQAIKFKDERELVSFCKSIQNNSPIDSFVECEPWDMPGYKDKVIMAAGTFVSGSSIELSCDAPIRKPYVAYLQGSLTFEHGQIAILNCLKLILNNINN